MDFFLNISIKTTFSLNPLDQLKAILCVVFVKTQTNQNSCKNYNEPESMMPHTISLPVPEKKSRGGHLDHVA